MKPMTRENVEAAFAGESQAHMKYLAFAEQAERDNFPNVARLFRAIAASEKRRALHHLRMLGEVGSTEENLQQAYEREDHEIETTYPAFSEDAKAEGENGADEAYSYTLEAEKSHRPLYDEAKSAVTAQEDIEETPIYVCTFCGRTVRGEAPEHCPVCDTPQEQFEVY